MVDALSEARRVLAPSGVLLDVRPVVKPIEVEVIGSRQRVWARTVDCFSAPEDIAAADGAMRHALASEWLVFQRSLPFRFEIECDNTAELREYVGARKLRGEEIPYEELDAQQRVSARQGYAARLRCSRPWMLNAYRRT